MQYRKKRGKKIQDGHCELFRNTIFRFGIVMFPDEVLLLHDCFYSCERENGLFGSGPHG